MSLNITSNNLILENYNGKDSIKELTKYNGLERSLFSEALEFTASIKDEIRSNSRDFYFALKEAENEKERANTFSKFNTILSNIIKKFINFISKIVEKFIAKLSLVFKSDKYIMENNKLLLLFSKEEGDEFQYECYNYTHIDDSDIPKSKPIYDIEYYINNIRSKLEESVIFTEDSTDLIVKGYSDMDDEHFYDRFRYKLINNDSEGTISAENFKEELFNVFRDGGSKNKITVTKDFVNKSYKRFADYKNLVETVKALRKETESTYRDLKSSLEKLLEVKNGRVYSSIDNGDTKEGSYKYHKLDLLIKGCIDKITNMTTIHSLAFTAKIDAMLECYKEDKKILTETIRRLKGRINESVNKEYYVGSLDNLDLNEDCLLEGLVDYNTRSKLMEQFDKLYDSSEYAMFLVSEANKQDLMLDYINNEILAESNIKFGLVTEASNIGSKVKNTINRILKFIAKLWAKFMEFFTKVFATDKKYLEKYKDIILNKPLKDAEFEMYDYENTGAIRAITDTTIPRFQYEQLKSLTGEKTEMEHQYLQKEPFNKFIDDESKSVAENFVEHYSGKIVKINSKSLNRTNIFNFIYSYNEMTNKLKQELNNFQKEADAAENFAKTHGGVKAESTVVEEDSLDKLLEDYFSEDVTIKSGDKANNGTPDQSKSAGNNTSTVSDETEEQNADRTTANQNSMETDSAEQAEILARVEIYFKTAKDLIQGKMNLAKRIYNDYFKIIQWHVKQYAGDKNEMEKDVKADEGEDFSLKDAIK